MDDNSIDYMFSSNGNSADFILVNDISFVVKMAVKTMTRLGIIILLINCLGVANPKRIYQSIIQ